MLPVKVKVPVAGLYSSADARPLMQLEVQPPAIRTFPLFRSVAVACARAVFKLPVAVAVPVVGS